MLKKKNQNPYEEIAKEYPIILTKPFFHFGWSLHNLKGRFTKNTTKKR